MKQDYEKWTLKELQEQIKKLKSEISQGGSLESKKVFLEYLKNLEIEKRLSSQKLLNHIEQCIFDFLECNLQSTIQCDEKSPIIQEYRIFPQIPYSAIILDKTSEIFEQYKALRSDFVIYQNVRARYFDEKTSTYKPNKFKNTPLFIPRYIIEYNGTGHTNTVNDNLKQELINRVKQNQIKSSIDFIVIENCEKFSNEIQEKRKNLALNSKDYKEIQETIFVELCKQLENGELSKVKHILQDELKEWWQ